MRLFEHRPLGTRRVLSAVQQQLQRVHIEKKAREQRASRHRPPLARDDVRLSGVKCGSTHLGRATPFGRARCFRSAAHHARALTLRSGTANSVHIVIGYARRLRCEDSGGGDTPHLATRCS